MNTRILIVNLFFICCAHGLQAQKSFLEGTIIKSNGDSIKAYIEATNWVLNPNRIRYKTSEEGDSKVALATDIRGFTVYNKGTFISAELAIDQSNDNVDQLSGSADPIWESQTVFLKQIIKGQVNLFTYKTSTFSRFIVHTSARGYEQLIYKKYTSGGPNVFYNKSYRSQLWNDYNCSITQADLKNVQYSEKSLKKFFLQYADCRSLTVEELKLQQAKGSFGFYTFAGVGSINGFFGDRNSSYNAYQSQSFRVDAGVEYKLPMKNSFSFFFNIASESFTANAAWANRVLVNRFTQEKVDQPWQVTASYGTIGLGIRKYQYFGRNSALRLSIMFVPEVTIWSDSSVEVLPISGVDNNPRVIQLAENSHLAFGVGYIYKLFSVEFRYFTTRGHLFSPTNLLRLEYGGYYFSLGINLTKKRK